MVINSLDLGSYAPFKMPQTGLNVGAVSILGGYAIPFMVDGLVPSWQATVWVQAPNAVGQYASKTLAATETLCRQLEELARNPDQAPVYVQFFAGTGTVALSPAFAQPQDGWYYLSSVTVDYTKAQFSYAVVTLQLQYVNPGPPRRVGIWNSGGALASTYSGSANNWVGFPLNSTAPYPTIAARTGAEGVVNAALSPGVNPALFVLSQTISDWFKGGCHVYDAMAAIGTNPVPAPPTVLNTNWIEVFGADHRFVGDIVITNGLHLITLSPAGGHVAYLWNTALGTAGWQSFASMDYLDNAGNGSTVRQVSLRRVGAEEVACEVVKTTSAGNAALLTYRLQRGAYAARLDFRPLTQTNAQANALTLNLASTPKIIYNSGTAIDNVVTGATLVAASADYGYAAAIIANTSYPFITGWLYQNAPAGQPQTNQNSNIGIGDSSGAKNGTRSYGFFAFPFSTPQNLQAEGESGSLGTGWSSIADAAASAGNTAKCASGTLSTNADLFGTAWSPPIGAYNVSFRVRVTSAAGNVAEMTLGLWDVTNSAYVASTTFKANQASTSYVWLTVSNAVINTAHSHQFRAVTAATLGTDWFIDEAALEPITSGNTPNFPQDLFQQWIYDRTTKQVLA